MGHVVRIGGGRWEVGSILNIVDQTKRVLRVGRSQDFVGGQDRSSDERHRPGCAVGFFLGSDDIVWWLD